MKRHRESLEMMQRSKNAVHVTHHITQPKSQNTKAVLHDVNLCIVSLPKYTAHEQQV